MPTLSVPFILCIVSKRYIVILLIVSMKELLESKTIKEEKITEFAKHKAAQAWCTPKTAKIDMVPELAEAFAEIIDEIFSQAWLGNATTRELLRELTTRIEVDGKLDYKTKGGI